MPAFVLIKGKIANINGKENIYLPAYAIITANNIEEIIINVLTNFDIFFVEVFANQLSKIYRIIKIISIAKKIFIN